MGWIFPDFQFAWIVPEFKSNLEEEFNFMNEARNSEIIAEQFKKDSQFATPKVYWEFTSRKMLTMQFIDGVKINDTEKLEKMGFKQTQIAQLMIDIFSRQIFVTGFLHSDPHPVS